VRSATEKRTESGEGPALHGGASTQGEQAVSQGRHPNIGVALSATLEADGQGV
jgi:hypothetical protein